MTIWQYDTIRLFYILWWVSLWYFAIFASYLFHYWLIALFIFPFFHLIITRNNNLGRCGILNKYKIRYAWNVRGVFCNPSRTRLPSSNKLTWGKYENALQTSFARKNVSHLRDAKICDLINVGPHNLGSPYGGARDLQTDNDLIYKDQKLYFTFFTSSRICFVFNICSGGRLLCEADFLRENVHQSSKFWALMVKFTLSTLRHRTRRHATCVGNIQQMCSSRFKTHKQWRNYGFSR